MTFRVVRPSVPSGQISMTQGHRQVDQTYSATSSSCLLSNLVAAAVSVYDLGAHVGGGRRMARSQRI